MGAGQYVPAMKDDRGNWDLRGHLNRLILIRENELRIFSQIFDEIGTPPHCARIPLIHSIEIVNVLRKFYDQERRVADLNNAYFATQFWNETNA
ncbi:unnamed protein product, partial [marine sediment metagenome]